MLRLRPLLATSSHFVSAFSCERILESNNHYLLEVKRTNDDGFVSSIQWFKISKDLLQISALNLKFIDSSYAIEERFFDEGYLKFTANTGIFIEKFNSGQHQYLVLDQVETAHYFTSILESYFDERKSLTN
jgi:hypothetical protein